GSGPETQVSNPLHPCRLLPSRALHLGREQQSTASDQSNELTPLHVEHGDVSPMRYQRRRLARSQSSAPSACRSAAANSLGPIRLGLNRRGGGRPRPCRHTTRAGAHCTTRFQPPLCPLWVIRNRPIRHRLSRHVRVAPKADN